MQAREYIQSLGNLAVQYSEAWQKGVTQYYECVTRAGRGEGGAPSPGGLIKRYLAYVQRDVPAAYLKVVESGMDFLSSTLDVGVELTNEFYKSVYEQPADAQGGTVANGPPPATDLVFEGAAGQTVSRSFIVANKTANAASVGFEISEFVSHDESQRVRAMVELTPSAFELQPGEEHVVNCRLPLTSDFRPGQPHHAVLRVTGFPHMDVTLLAIVTGEEISAEPQEPKRGAKKKTPVKKTARKSAPRKRKKS